MSWDQIYRQLQKELGRAPTAEEVQRRLLEIFARAAGDGGAGLGAGLRRAVVAASG